MVRPLAQQLGLIPFGLDAAQLSSGATPSCYPSNYSDHYDFLEDAYDSYGYVRGTRIAFPEGGPKTKYAAVLNPSDFYDKLRESFILQGDGTGLRFRTALQGMLAHSALTPELHSIAALMLHAVSALTEAQRGLTVPADLIPKAWPVYLASIRQFGYYFSVDELITAATVAKVRLVVLRHTALT